MSDTIAVDDTYRHVAKQASAGTILSLGSSRLKWYDIARAETQVEPAIHGMAREFLEAEAAKGVLGIDRDVGFVLLHRCGTDFYFLIVCSWRNSNELWKSVYYKDGVTMPGFDLYPLSGRHWPTYCVWELGPIVHEQKAWIRYLKSERGERDLRAYLEFRFEGEV
jgi:hypothetical protein